MTVGLVKRDCDVLPSTTRALKLCYESALVGLSPAMITAKDDHRQVILSESDN